jgi:menaquinone-specific isochorismate synthase
VSQLRAATLVAHTAHLEAEPADLTTFAGAGGVLWEHAGVSLAGRGVVVRVAPDMAAPLLRSIEIESDDVDRPGAGPVALGALPFAPDAGGSLVVPREVVGRDRDGNYWWTAVSEHGVSQPLTRPPRALSATPARSPSDFRLTAVPSHERWCSAVAHAVERIEAGELDKVVLARSVEVEAARPLVITDILRRLRALFPSCMVFSVDGFVGASPELLVARLGRDVRAQPLAGTIARSGDPETDERLARELLHSPKDRHEHGLVVDAVASALAPCCERLDVPPVPAIVPLRNVSHLGTAISGRLHAPPTDALELARRLHPTPAVAGAPTAAALGLIAELEGPARGRYAGPVGWVDRDGNGEWAVGIRSAQIDGTRARLMAGNGIVAGSDPQAELAETQLKLQALLAAIVRP